MVDETKRKRILYTTAAFVGIVIISAIVWAVFFNKTESLPPEEPIQNETSNNTEATTPTAPIDKDKSVPTVKNGITFNYFDELTLISMSGSRVDLIQFYLSEEANSQTAGLITEFTLQKGSIKETKQGERNFITFGVKDNRNNAYTVELSYSSSVDTYVRILDKENIVIQESPYDTE